MEYPQHSIPTEMPMTLNQVMHWTYALLQLHSRIAARFARPEPRRRVLAYLQGLLSATERKNGWQLAEQAREATPYGMQRLLSQAVWDVDGVRDDVRTYALEHLGRQGPIVVIDETSFPKRGKHSAGIQMQYCGTTGQVENCQVGVFLDYVTPRGHTLIDRELYLPLGWTEDQERRRAAGIPADVRFQTKCELAQQMLARLCKADVPLSWVVADTVYGGNLDLRNWLEAHQYSYVLAVACTEPVGMLTPCGRRRVEVAQGEALQLHDHDWQRLALGQGTKGERLFDWAAVPLLHRWKDDGRHWLLIRRCVDDPTKKAYYLVFAPQGTTLPEMVQAIGARWCIEQDFETAKELGLDHYEVRSWTGWYRHITLCLLAHAFLTGLCVQDTLASDGSAMTPEGQGLLPLTVPEVRHVLGHLVWPAPSSVKLILGWSWWRRCHQRRASLFHRRRRCQVG